MHLVKTIRLLESFENPQRVELDFSYFQFSRRIAFTNLLVSSRFGIYPYCRYKRCLYQKSISSKRSAPWHPLKIQKELLSAYCQFFRKIAFSNLLVSSGFKIYPYCGDKGAYIKNPTRQNDPRPGTL